MNRKCLSFFMASMCFGCVSWYTVASQEKKYSRWDNIRDQFIGCMHWIGCPYCVKDSARQRKNFLAAIVQNRPDIVEHIVRRRFMDPNEQLDGFKLPIITAAEHGNAEVVKMLLRLGVDVNRQVVDRNGYKIFPSALIAACASENSDQEHPSRIAATVKVLIEHGADPRLRCVWQTPSEEKEIERVRKELQQNPRGVPSLNMLKAQSWLSEERTAVDFAIKNKYVQVLTILRKALESK